MRAKESGSGRTLVPPACQRAPRFIRVRWQAVVLLPLPHFATQWDVGEHVRGGRHARPFPRRTPRLVCRIVARQDVKDVGPEGVVDHCSQRESEAEGKLWRKL